MKRNGQRQESRLDEAGEDSNLAADHYALATVSSVPATSVVNSAWPGPFASRS